MANAVWREQATLDINITVIVPTSAAGAGATFGDRFEVR
jgi:hypothetical protein